MIPQEAGEGVGALHGMCVVGYAGPRVIADPDDDPERTLGQPVRLPRHQRRCRKRRRLPRRADHAEIGRQAVAGFLRLHAIVWRLSRIGWRLLSGVRLWRLLAVLLRRADGQLRVLLANARNGTAAIGREGNTALTRRRLLVLGRRLLVFRRWRLLVLRRRLLVFRRWWLLVLWRRLLLIGRGLLIWRCFARRGLIRNRRFFRRNASAILLLRA